MKNKTEEAICANYIHFELWNALYSTVVKYVLVLHFGRMAYLALHTRKTAVNIFSPAHMETWAFNCSY